MGFRKANMLKIKAAKTPLIVKRNKKTAIKAAKAFKIIANASKSKLTYKMKKGNAKIKISKAGKITVAKGLKKGKTYKVKVTVTSAQTATYKSAHTTVALKVKVK